MPNEGDRFKIPIILILVLVLLPPLLMVLTVGTPSARQDSFIHCTEETKQELKRSLNDCRKLPTLSQRKGCRGDIKQKRMHLYFACRKHLSPAERAPTPTPPPITQPCIATSPQSWQSCLAEVNSGQRYMIEVAKTIECSGPDACAGILHDVSGQFEIKIFSKKGTNYGFIRRDNYDYSILTIANSMKVRVSNLLFNDDITKQCLDCSQPVISVRDSRKVHFEEITIANAKSYGVVAYSLLEGSFKMSNFINIQNTAIWLPFFRTEKVLSMDIDLFANRFIGCRSHAILNQSMGRPERISSIMYNHFISNGNGITLIDPARLLAIEHNLIADGIAQGGGGNGILAFTEKGAQPNVIHDIYLLNNMIINNSGWGVLKISKRNPACMHIINQDNHFKDNQCRGDSGCEERSSYRWSCDEAGDEAPLPKHDQTQHISHNQQAPPKTSAEASFQSPRPASKMQHKSTHIKAKTNKKTPKKPIKNRQKK